jgi:hypothetical protein
MTEGGIAAGLNRTIEQGLKQERGAAEARSPIACGSLPLAIHFAHPSVSLSQV